MKYASPPARRVLLVATAFAAGFALSSSRAYGAAPPTGTNSEVPEAVAQDTDPTKPVLFSVREEYYNLPGSTWENLVILRRDELLLKKTELPGKTRGILTRFELPVATFHVGDQTSTGLGDGYAQALILPKLGGPFLLGIGSGLIVPTATSNSLGPASSGKWTIAPTIVPAWYLPRQGFAFVKFQEFNSFAGPSDRASISYFLITPTAFWRVTKHYWMLVDSEMRSDWEKDGLTSFKSGILVGRMFTPRVGLSLKAEVPWGNHRLGDWTLKASLFLTRF